MSLSHIQAIRSASVPVWIFVAVTACAEPRADSSVETRSSADQSSVPWVLTEDLRIGSAESGGPEQFGFISGLAVDDAGNIYVLDEVAQDVRVFDASGAHVRTIGGQGEGPGEFVGAADLFLDPAGRLWVTDARTSRYSVFSPRGVYVEGHPRPLRGFASAGAAFDREGRLTDWGLSFPEESPDVVAGPVISFDPVRFSADFSVRDTLPSLIFDQDLLSDGSRPQVFFAGQPLVFQRPGGDTWFARSSDYRVFRRNANGDTVAVLGLEVDPIPIGEAEREQVRVRLRGRPETSDYLEGLPETRPVLASLFADGEGHVFVIPDVQGAPGGTAVDVFTDEGVYVGRSRFPQPIRTPGEVPVATSSHLYVIVEDEFDVPYVSRLRITKPGG